MNKNTHQRRKANVEEGVARHKERFHLVFVPGDVFGQNGEGERKIIGLLR